MDTALRGRKHSVSASRKKLAKTMHFEGLDVAGVSLVQALDLAAALWLRVLTAAEQLVQSGASPQ